MQFICDYNYLKLQPQQLHNHLTKLLNGTVQYLAQFVKHKFIIGFEIPYSSINIPYHVNKILNTNGSFDDIKIKWSTHLQHTNYSRRLLENIQCRNCLKFYSERAFCGKYDCEVFDQNKISYYTDNNHLGKYGWEHEVPVYRRFFKSESLFV